MRRSIKKGQRLWKRRDLFGLLGALLCAPGIVWGGCFNRPKLSLHEADYYLPSKEADKE
jgi:hypothetical protein